MGRYRDTMKEVDHKAKGTHPVWRGIGCGLMILVPVLSFAAASVSMPFLLNRGMIPQQLLLTPQIPDWLWYAPALAQIVQFLFVHPAIYAILLLTFMYVLILGGVFSVLYAFMYRTVAPARYGPLDAPPPKVKIKKYRR